MKINCPRNVSSKDTTPILWILIVLVNICPSVFGQIREGNLEFSAVANSSCIYLCEPIELFIKINNIGSVVERVDREISRSAGTLSVSIVGPDNTESKCDPGYSVFSVGKRTIAPSDKIIIRDLLVGDRNGYLFNKAGRYILKAELSGSIGTIVELSDIVIEVKKPEGEDLIAHEMVEKIWSTYDNTYDDGFEYSTQEISEWKNIYQKYPRSVYSKYALYAYSMAIYLSDTNDAACIENIVELLSDKIAQEDKWQLRPESVMLVAHTYRKIGKMEKSIILIGWLNSKEEIEIQLEEESTNFKNEIIDNAFNNMLVKKVGSNPNTQFQ